MMQILKKTEGLEKISDFIRNNDGFTLICHVAPDGDTLGSALALYGMMKMHGKRVQIVCQDRVPQNLLFLPWSHEVLCPDKAVCEDNVIAVDCADIGRLGKAVRLFDAAKNTVSIDHHGTNGMYAMLNEVHPHCAATAEIVYELVRIFAGNISADVATCLYVGLMTDTGSFAFGNTTADTFAVASALVRSGANPCTSNTLVYRTVPLSKTKLLAKALSGVDLYDGGRIGMCIITQTDMAVCKAKAEDSEGIIDHIRDIETVEIAIFVREWLDGDYKVSLRSTEYADVAQLAQDFGGGGHVRAAGFKITMDLQKLCDALITSAKEMISLYEEN